MDLTTKNCGVGGECYAWVGPLLCDSPQVNVRKLTQIFDSAASLWQGPLAYVVSLAIETALSSNFVKDLGLS
jgi:hypothetical protein